MTYDALNDLLISYEKAEIENLWDYDYYFFTLFYDIFKEKPNSEIPDAAFMFMEIDGWQGMSQRCGVWQHYESRAFEPDKLERVLKFLKSQNEEEMARIYAYGIHDYAAPEYAENDEFNYPDEWLDESDKIDDWITDNEEHIYRWKRELILSHRNEILELAENK